MDGLGLVLSANETLSMYPIPPDYLVEGQLPLYVRVILPFDWSCLHPFKLSEPCEKLLGLTISSLGPVRPRIATAMLPFADVDYLQSHLPQGVADANYQVL